MSEELKKVLSKIRGIKDNLSVIKNKYSCSSYSKTTYSIGNIQSVFYFHIRLPRCQVIVCDKIYITDDKEAREVFRILKEINDEELTKNANKYLS